MKITGVRTKTYEITLDRPLGDANNPIGRPSMSSLAVFIDTDDGITGVAQGSPGSRALIHSLVENLLVGHDPRGVRGLWTKMNSFAFKGGNKGAINDAINTIDVALWDAKAKA